MRSYEEILRSRSHWQASLCLFSLFRRNDLSFYFLSGFEAFVCNRLFLLNPTYFSVAQCSVCAVSSFGIQWDLIFAYPTLICHTCGLKCCFPADCYVTVSTLCPCVMPCVPYIRRPMILGILGNSHNGYLPTKRLVGFKYFFVISCIQIAGTKKDRFKRKQCVHCINLTKSV